MIGEPFVNFVRSRVEFRNDSLALRHDMNVEIDPEIMDIIMGSTAMSTQKGSSAHLLKVGSKRRRTRAEIEEIKLNEMDRMAHQASQE